MRASGDVASCIAGGASTITAAVPPGPPCAPPATGAARYVVLVPVALAALANAPVLGSYFFMDDFLHLYRAANDQPLWPFLLQMYGGHLLMTRNAVLALTYHVFGADPLPFFAIVLATHLVNVALVYRAARLLAGSWRLAVVAAVLWGTAPVQLGTLGWYSVYGQVLAATAGLWVFARLAACGAGAPARPLAPLGWCVALLIGSTCFGTGIGTALVMPAAAWLLLPPSRLRRRSLLALMATAVAVPLLYVAVYRLEQTLVGYDPTNPTWFMLAAGRNLIAHLYVFAGLVERGSADVLLGAAAGDAPPWLAAGLLATAVAAGLARSPQRVARPLLAAALFSLGAYGIIAAGRSFFAVEDLRRWVSLDRYHYTATIGLAWAAAIALGGLGVRLPARAANGLLAIAALAITGANAGLRPPFDGHRPARQETAHVLANIRGQIAAAPPGSVVRIPNRVFHSVGPANVGATTLFPGTMAVWATFAPPGSDAGRRVVFTTGDPPVAAAAAHGRRSATLLRLVPPTPPAP